MSGLCRKAEAAQDATGIPDASITHSLKLEETEDMEEKQ
jgi:hypothetical protein